MRLSHATQVALIAPIVGLAAAADVGGQSPQEVFASDLKELRERFIGLAETIPADQFTWRPDSAARSVSELFMHVASATYFHMQHLGVDIPKGAFRGNRDLETVVDKATVLEILRESFDHAAQNLTEADTAFAGRHSMATHLHEHLGQAIAYTRTLGLTPPWTEAR